MEINKNSKIKVLYEGEIIDSCNIILHDGNIGVISTTGKLFKDQSKLLIIVNKDGTNELLLNMESLRNKLANAEKEISKLNKELRSNKRLIVELSTRSNDKR